MNNDKISLGQFFTTSNPFITKAFKSWVKEIPLKRDTLILEPFAGSNNIPYMIRESGILLNDWKCFDISPSIHNKCKQYPIEKNDSLENFPKGFTLCITNPPYLGKNSATRRKIPYPNTSYEDLYQLCVERALLNCDYVAAIIPETFLISGLFTNRLSCVISLTCKMFDDTECPVCLALFDKQTSDDFKIYQMDTYLGSYNQLIKGKVFPKKYYNWKMNDPNGDIGIICIDSTKNDSICFCRGETIDSKNIKVSSRSITRVSGLPVDVNLDLFILRCNEILTTYRRDTSDVFLASFKGLRSDGNYRRRLDFTTAKQIMSKALEY